MPIVNARLRWKSELLGFCGILLLPPTAAFAQAPEPPPGESFFDDFTGSLNLNRWYISDGWVNGDHQNCTWTADRLGLTDDILTLSLTDQPRGERDYSCAEIQTIQRFGYGTFEALMKIPATSGLNSNFFSHVGAPQGEPHNEIDFEFLGRMPDTVQLNYYANGEGGHEEIVPVPEAGERFRRYAFVWEPGRLRWYVDDELLLETTDTGPTEPQKIYFSIWGTDTLVEWLGPFEYPGEPLVMSVDWVAFTAAGEPCQFEASIVCDLDGQP
jgi:endo-1,3-1,4-beta-glycanase ExoK